MKLDKGYFQKVYERWWLGKLVLPVNHFRDEKPKRVLQIELVGAPSFFYGEVFLTFEDGTQNHVAHDGFRPRKKDMEVYDG